MALTSEERTDFKLERSVWIVIHIRGSQEVRKSLDSTLKRMMRKIEREKKEKPDISSGLETGCLTQTLSKRWN